MKLITKEVKIGIAGVISLFILVFGINYLKGISLFRPSSYFFVKFENIDGLAKSAPVYANGVKVGLVREIIYDYTAPGNVVVEIEVNTEMRIPTGTTAELIPQLMGEVQMKLLLTNNPYGELQVGDTLQGYLNGGIFEAASKMLPQVATLIPKIDSALVALNAILSDENIPATLKSAEKTMSNLAVVSSDLKTLMKNDIPQLTNKLSIMSDNFISVSDQLKEIDYAGIAKEIDSTLANVKLITDKVNEKNNTIGLLFNDPELYNNLNQTAINASNLLLDLKEHPKRYVQFSVFGRKDK